jgi:hypothetical protein
MSQDSNPPFNRRDSFIQADAQWNEAFWVVRGTLPIDLTGKTLELYVRPRFDNATLIRKLSSATGEIVIDNATKGSAHIFVTAANVAAGIPPGVWDQFLRLVNGAGDIEEIWRGRLTVYAGVTT